MILKNQFPKILPAVVFYRVLITGLAFRGGKKLFMEQMNLFNDDPLNIPKTVLSPIECNKKLNSQDFAANQKLFSEYVKMIQRQHKCSWFEARQLFFKIRDIS